jgi:hypothetical protein
LARSQNYAGLLNEQTSSINTSIFTVIIHFELPLGTRPVGRPKTRWEDVKADIKKMKVPNWKTTGPSGKVWLKRPKLYVRRRYTFERKLRENKEIYNLFITFSEYSYRALHEGNKMNLILTQFKLSEDLFFSTAFVFWSQLLTTEYESSEIYS